MAQDEIKSDIQAFVESLGGRPEGLAADDVTDESRTDDQDDDDTDAADAREGDEAGDQAEQDPEEGDDEENDEPKPKGKQSEQDEPDPAAAAQRLVDLYTPAGVQVLEMMVQPEHARRVVPLVLQQISESLGIPVQELVGMSAPDTSDTPDDWEDMTAQERAAWIQKQVDEKVAKATEPMKKKQDAAEAEREATRWTENNVRRVGKALRAKGVLHFDVNHSRLLKVIRENPNARSSVEDATAAFIKTYAEQILKVERRGQQAAPKSKGPEAPTNAAPGGTTRGNTLGDEAVQVAMAAAAQRTRR